MERKGIYGAWSPTRADLGRKVTAYFASRGARAAGSVGIAARQGIRSERAVLMAPLRRPARPADERALSTHIAAPAQVSSWHNSEVPSCPLSCLKLGLKRK